MVEAETLAKLDRSSIIYAISQYMNAPTVTNGEI
jgi:hypothetical protein